MSTSPGDGHSEAAAAQGASLASPAHPNEDRWGAWKGVRWVIDGASSAPGRRGGHAVSAYVAELDRALRQAVDQEEQASLLDVLEVAIRRVSGTPAGSSGHSATVALCRRSPDGAEWAVLGDSAVLIRDGERTVLRQDNRLQRVAPELRRIKSGLVERRAPRAEVAEVTRQIRACEEDLRNREGGFWVAAADPGAARQALHGYGSAGAEVLLMTDGVTDGLERSYWGSPADLLRDVRESGPEKTLSRFRNWLGEHQLVADDMTLAVT